MLLKAFAKVNLALAVDPPEPAGPRAGWHRIASWMHAIDLADDVEVVPADTGGITLDLSWAPDAPRPSPIDWPPDRDLTVRAARALETELGRPIHVRIRLAKRIPTGGGLGGGSSDAAAVLRGLGSLLNLDSNVLLRAGAKVGSDVAFFLDEIGPTQPPRPALVGGFGDEIKRLPACRDALTLFLPAFGCATPEVYRAFDALGAPRSGRFHSDGIRAASARSQVNETLLLNDLTPAAQRIAPELASLTSRLQQALGRPIHMSGSGSTLFALGRHEPVGEIATIACRLLGDA